MTFNEDSRVKIPTILHVIRLRYSYLSLSEQSWDESNNIFTSIFKESVRKINSDLQLSDGDIDQLFDEVSLCLENEDLGKSFYEKLVDQANIKLIDFKNFNDNSFHVVTELT